MLYRLVAKAFEKHNDSSILRPLTLSAGAAFEAPSGAFPVLTPTFIRFMLNVASSSMNYIVGRYVTWQVAGTSVRCLSHRTVIQGDPCSRRGSSGDAENEGPSTSTRARYDRGSK
jgi:hypothetical protein